MRRPHVNDNKLTPELVDGQIFKIDINARDPTTDEELRQVCKMIGKYYRIRSDEDAKQLRSELGPFNYKHG